MSFADVQGVGKRHHSHQC